MSILGRFTQQPAETLDYLVDFSEWFNGRTDLPASFTVTAPAGITVAGSSREGNVVRVVLSGGAVGVSYKVTVRLSTTSSPPIVKEADFIVRIKDS